MKYYLTQTYTPNHSELFDLTSPINSAYAEKAGFEYVTNNKINCPERAVWWEKIAWLNKFLPTIEDGSYVVYEDCDSLNIGGDLKTALPTGFEFGMVQIRHGLGTSELFNWYNGGVIVMLNTQNVRDFLVRSWNRGGLTDEKGINAELKSTNWTIGNKPICSMGVEWNSWRNNLHLTDNSFIVSWHGMGLSDKISAIKDFIPTIK